MGGRDSQARGRWKGGIYDSYYTDGRDGNASSLLPGRRDCALTSWLIWRELRWCQGLQGGRKLLFPAMEGEIRPLPGQGQLTSRRGGSLCLENCKQLA